MTLIRNPRTEIGKDKGEDSPSHLPEVNRQQAAGRGQGKSSRKGRKKEKRDS